MTDPVRWLLVLLIGVLVGGGATAADAAADGLDPAALSRVAAIVLNAGFVWAGAAVLAGWVIGSERLVGGAVAGVVVLVMLGAIGAISGTVRLWALAAVVAGPLLGVVGSLARQRDSLGYLCRIVVPVGAAVEVLIVRDLAPETFTSDPTMAWTQTGVLVAAALAIAAAVLTARREPSA